jgi:hypothetical protein
MLFLTGCSGAQIYVGAEAGPVDVTVAVDNNGKVSVSGGIAPKFKVGLGPIQLKVGVQQTLELTKEKPFTLFVIWEDENGEIQREDYEIGKAFHIIFTQNELIQEIQGDNNSVIVAVRRPEVGKPTSEPKVMIDAKNTTKAQPIKLSLPTNAGWVDTDILVKAGQSVIITAEGNANNSNGDPESNTTPSGYIRSSNGLKWGDIYCDKNYMEKVMGKQYPIDCLMSGAPYGALIGRLGNSAPFLIGTTYQFQTTDSGKLYLAYNDCCVLSDNIGAYSVTIFLP